MIDKYLYRWRDMVAWLPVIGLLMVISAMPYGWSAYQRIGLYVLGVGYVADYIVNKRWQLITWNRGKWIYVIMLAFVVMFFVREWFDPTALTSYAFSQFHLHEWFLYVGIAGIIGFSDKLKMKHVAYVMLATSAVMAMTCYGLYFFMDKPDYLSSNEFFNLMRREYINSHMVMNLYLNTAMILGFCVLRSESVRWKRIVLFAAIIFAWILIMLSDGRIGQATSLLVMFVCGILALPRKHMYWGLTIGLLLTICAGLFVAHNPRMRLERVAHDPRAAIFDYSWRMIKKEPITGYGLSTLSVKYVEEAYQDSVMYNGYILHIQSIPEFVQLGKTMKTHHSHNAFLHYWLIFGILGPVLLLALFATSACLPIDRHYRIYLWLFLMALLIQCMTEPIGQHIKPQFISIILFAWQWATLPAMKPEKEEPCVS